jgi:hypothetical protein
VKSLARIKYNGDEHMNRNIIESKSLLKSRKKFSLDTHISKSKNSLEAHENSSSCCLDIKPESEKKVNNFHTRRMSNLEIINSKIKEILKPELKLLSSVEERRKSKSENKTIKAYHSCDHHVKNKEEENVTKSFVLKKGSEGDKSSSSMDKKISLKNYQKIFKIESIKLNLNNKLFGEQRKKSASNEK